MVASDFCEWINSNLLPSVREHHPNIPDSVSVRTARRWLHKLGFDPCSTKKGVYIDGHEQSDVVEYRKLYLRRLEVISLTHVFPPFCKDEQPVEPFIGLQCKNVVIMFSFSMMRVHFILMRIKDGCGQRKESNLLDPRDLDEV